jgi:hypothetical protein
MVYHGFPGRLFSHSISKALHFVLHCLTFAFVTAAIAVVFYNHDKKAGTTNMASAHSFMGIIGLPCFPTALLLTRFQPTHSMPSSFWPARSRTTSTQTSFSRRYVRRFCFFSSFVSGT